MILQRALGLVLGLVLLSITVFAILEAERDSSDRLREIQLERSGEEFLQAAEVYLAEGSEGEGKLLAIARSENLSGKLRLRAAAVIATGPGEKGREERRRLAGGSSRVRRDGLAALFTALFLDSGPVLQALEERLAKESQPLSEARPAGVPGGSAAGPETAPADAERPLIDLVAEALGEGSRAISVDLSTPDASGRRKVVVGRAAPGR